eukprot:TRINITY_DN11922_c0_g1_i1.p1 TRINITY_DN11922_c0_g1~~TRINITY_DN11922_c0_g1_i1.p1  ORF type:complete len:165 (-),score=21.64 TRINITY_DN11922_c0_g1_i1:254-679(-)
MLQSPSIKSLAGLAAVTIGLNVIVIAPRVVKMLKGTPGSSWKRGDTANHPSPDFAKRALDAHANSIENLVPTGALILCAAAANRLDVTDPLAPFVLYARIAQAIVHVAFPQTDAVVVPRALAFFVQVIAQTMWASRLLGLV